MEATVEVKLAGKSKILQFLVQLETEEEGEVDLTLFTIDGGKTYFNSDVFIEWKDKLNVLVIVKAFGKVPWDFAIKDQASGKFLIKGSGETGDTSMNFSKKQFTFSASNQDANIIDHETA